MIVTSVLLAAAIWSGLVVFVGFVRGQSIGWMNLLAFGAFVSGFCASMGWLGVSP